MPIAHTDPLELPKTWPLQRETMLLSGLMRQRHQRVEQLNAQRTGDIASAACDILDIAMPAALKDWSKLSDDEARQLYERSTGLKLDEKGRVIR